MKALLSSDRSYHIFLGGRDINKAQDAARAATSEIQSESTVEALRVDVEDDESISKAFEHVSSKQPRIDCLINNAGKEIAAVLFPRLLEQAQVTTFTSWMVECQLEKPSITPGTSM